MDAYVTDLAERYGIHLCMHKCLYTYRLIQELIPFEEMCKHKSSIHESRLRWISMLLKKNNVISKELFYACVHDVNISMTNDCIVDKTNDGYLRINAIRNFHDTMMKFGFERCGIAYELSVGRNRNSPRISFEIIEMSMDEWEDDYKPRCPRRVSIITKILAEALGPGTRDFVI